MLRAIRYAVGAAAVLAAGGLFAQTGKCDTPYFPLREGAEWTYKVGAYEVKQRVVKADKVGGEDHWQVDTVVGKDPKTSEWYVVRADGVYRTKVQTDKLDPYVKVLPLPVAKDATWTVDTKMGTQTIKGTFKVKNDKEKLAIPDGKGGTRDVETVFVEAEGMDIAGAKTTVRLWFAKDIGVVKEEFVLQNNDRVTLELLSSQIPPPK